MPEYACIAATEFGGRCRHLAKAPSLYCGIQHSDGCELAPPPDQVLLKLRVNKTWRDTFVASGLNVVARSETKQNAINQRHIDHADEFGRGAFVIRKDAPDSGTPVFGKKGAEAISVKHVLFELGSIGYNIANVHVLESKDKTGRPFSMYTLVLDLQKTVTQQPSPLSPLGQKMVEELVATSRWGFVHVWANPPKNGTGIVHTVNCSHREGKPALGILLYNGGLWEVAPAP